MPGTDYGTVVPAGRETSGARPSTAWRAALRASARIGWPTMRTGTWGVVMPRYIALAIGRMSQRYERSDAVPLTGSMALVPMSRLKFAPVELNGS